jgi:hypothetical protein
VEGTAREILARVEAEDNESEGVAFREAREWLLDFLMDGPKTAKEVQSAGREAWHASRTLRRASVPSRGVLMLS